MRELEREPSPDTPACTRLAIVGQGRVGNAIARALTGAVTGAPTDPGALTRDFELIGPLGRGADGAGADAVLLCVPDAEIANASAAIEPGPFVGHCSGATGLDPLAPHPRFSLHPLMTITASRTPPLNGAGAAIAGSSPAALDLARRLARALQLVPIEIDQADRAAYHAAASIASNFLITLEAAAERLATTAGVQRELLVPLVRATVENWAEVGAERALTGPVARGDEATVASQRAAIAERAPELLSLFDELVEATRALADSTPTVGLAGTHTVGVAA